VDRALFASEVFWQALSDALRIRLIGGPFRHDGGERIGLGVVGSGPADEDILAGPAQEHVHKHSNIDPPFLPAFGGHTREVEYPYTFKLNKWQSFRQGGQRSSFALPKPTIVDEIQGSFCIRWHWHTFAPTHPS
jgi:hypothetical protein